MDLEMQNQSKEALKLVLKLTQDHVGKLDQQIESLLKQRAESERLLKSLEKLINHQS